MSRTPTVLLAVTLLFAPGFVGAQATTATAVTPPATVAPSTTVADTVKEATASEDLQREALARLEQIGHWRDLAQRVTVLEADLDALAAGAMAAAELVDPIDLDRQLRALDRAATTVVDDLASIVRRLEHDDNALESEVRKWQERQLFLAARQVPASVLERARSIEAKLQRASEHLREFRDGALLALDRALALQARVNGARALIATRQERIRAHRMEVERSSIWQLAAVPAQFERVAADLGATWRSLREYLLRERGALGGLFVGVLAVAYWLFVRRSGQDAETPQRAYGRPIAASLLIALMSLFWLLPDPPILFYEALFVLVPIPAAMVAQRAIAAPIRLTLYGIALATMLLPLRNAIEASATAVRLLLILQALCIAVPVAVDLRRGRLQQALPRWSPAMVRAVALLVMVAAALTTFNAIFGFAGPAGRVRTGMGSFLGYGLVFGATAFALYGAALALLATPVMQGFRSARNADPALLRTLRRALAALAIVGVIAGTVTSLGLMPALRAAIDSLMDSTLDVGTVSFTARAVVTAIAVAVATLVLTGVTGFILDREIVPRLQLRPGAGYAIVTFTRWSMLIIGAALTLIALGIDMAKVTLLAGALSVGIGFGLQNVVNNFVSGLILIVERPVGVGDVIERGTLSGTVTRIGIRSSTVRTGQGAEVIVPNAELVSKEVVNWTRSDRQRRYDIDVGVAPGSEPEQVMRLLVEAAKDVPEIMAHPAPRAMFKGFGDSSLNFTLLAWVPTVDVGLEAQNALRVAILRKLDGAGIAIPFPQRDVHVHSADDRVGPAKG